MCRPLIQRACLKRRFVLKYDELSIRIAERSILPRLPKGFCADKRVDSIARDEIVKYGRIYVQNHYS
mgnify:CR=1 FL=1